MIFRRRLWALWTLLLILPVAVWLLYPAVQRFLESQSTNEVLLLVLALVFVLLISGLVFVIVRNLARLVGERKRGIMGARLRTKLVFFYVPLVLLPSTVLFIGSAQIINETVEAILRTPMEDLSKKSSEVVDQWKVRFKGESLRQAERIAAEADRLRSGDADAQEAIARLAERWLVEHELGSVRIHLGDPAAPYVARDADWAGTLAPSIDESVGQLQTTGEPTSRIVNVDGRLIVHAAVRGEATTVAIASRLPELLAEELGEFSRAAQSYRQFRIHRRQLVRLYVTSIALIYLASLLVAIWIGFYLARRITVPIQELALATREIAAGNLDVRVAARAGDEIGGLVESFNEMAGELEESRAVITRSTADLRRSNRALDERRRYIEALIANLSTGVLSIDPAGAVTTSNPALGRILGLDLLPGDPAEKLLERHDGLAPLVEMLRTARWAGEAPVRRDVTIAVDDKKLPVAVQVTPLVGPSAERVGTLLMVEDLSDVVQAQRSAAWREVARRIAHEIKNPLTPIQLSAQRLRKKLEEEPDELPRVLPDATAAIEREVGALKDLVDEFSRFARMPEVRTEPVDFRQVVENVQGLYAGNGGIHWQLEIAPEIGEVQVDPQQIRRVLINLIDNAIAAMDGEGTIRLAARALGDVAIRLEVSDSGPGIPASHRERMFEPYFSTKKRGTGLGLAIVHKVVTDHRGTIRVEDNEPRGARFVIELPA